MAEHVRPPFVLVFASDLQGCGFHRCAIPLVSLVQNGMAEGRLDLSLLPDAEADLLPLLPPQIAAHLPMDRLSLNLQAAGPTNALAIRGVADFGDLHIEAKPVLNLIDGAWRGTIGLRHPGAARLIAAMGFANPVDWLGSGSFSLSGALSGNSLSWPPQSVSTDGIDLAAGQLRALLAGSLNFANQPIITGHISAEALPLLLPPLRDKQPLPFERLIGWQAKLDISAKQVLLDLDPVLLQFSTRVTVQDGTLSADAISAKLNDGVLSGHLLLSAGSGPPKIQSDLSLTGSHQDAPMFGLPIDLAGGVLDANLSLQASGFAAQTLLSTLEGKLHLVQHDGSLLGVDLARMGSRLEDADLRAALAEGSTAISVAEVSVAIQNGSLQFEPPPAVNAATGPSGRAEVSGLIDLVGRGEELHLSLTPSVTAPPSFGLRVGGSLDAPTRAIEISDAASWRAEHLPPPVPPLPLPPPTKPSGPAAKPIKPQAPSPPKPRGP